MVFNAIVKFFKNCYVKDYDNIISILPIFLCFGVIIGFRYNNVDNTEIFLCITVISLIISYLSYRFNATRHITIVFFAIFFIFLGYTSSIYRFEAKNKNYIIKSEEKNVLISAKIDSIVYGEKYNKVIIKDISIDKSIQSPKKLYMKISLNSMLERLHSGYNVELFGDIVPLPGVIYKDAYNFAEVAYFNDIGGIFKLHNVVSVKKNKASTISEYIDNLRNRINTRIINSIKNSDNAAIIMALFTGNTYYLDNTIRFQIQKAGLSHLLAISGMHVSVIAVTIFILLRRLMLASEYITLRYNTKKIAAFLSIFICISYLAISGFPISATRSFVMFTIGLIAVIIDRYPVPIRVLGFALVSILIFNPEAMFYPSLQMSFMAVLGLITGISEINQRFFKNAPSYGFVKKYLFYFFSISVSSKIATLCTFPYSIYHFNQYSNIGMISNIFAVPLVELIILPIGVATFFLSVIGLDGFMLSIMSYFVDIFRDIAIYSASYKYATSVVKEMPANAMLIMTFGIIWLLVMRQNWRYFGIVIIFIGCIIHNFHKLPDAIIYKDNKSMIFKVGNQYYSYGRISNSFVKKIWQGRVGQRYIKYLNSNILEKYFIIYKWGICSKMQKLCVVQKPNLFTCKDLTGYNILSDEKHTCYGNKFLTRINDIDSFSYFKLKT
jgi:competence protein ComEC